MHVRNLYIHIHLFICVCTHVYTYVFSTQHCTSRYCEGLVDVGLPTRKRTHHPLSRIRLHDNSLVGCTWHAMAIWKKPGAFLLCTPLLRTRTRRTLPRHCLCARQTLAEWRGAKVRRTGTTDKHPGLCENMSTNRMSKELQDESGIYVMKAECMRGSGRARLQMVQHSEFRFSLHPYASISCTHNLRTCLLLCG